jgi:hypothetical protein
VEAKVSDLDLSVQGRIAGETLVIRYTVENRSGRDVYLLNRLYTTVPPRLSPDIAYVELDQREHVVEVSKVLASMPAGAAPTSPVAPYVTPVRAHERFSEDIHLRLPLRRYQQYHNLPAEPDKEQIVQYQGVTFTVGYYWREPGVYEEPATAFDQPVIIPKGFKGFPSFGSLTAPVLPIAVPVVERRQ